VPFNEKAMSIFASGAITVRIAGVNRPNFSFCAANRIDRARSGPSPVVIGSVITRLTLVEARCAPFRARSRSSLV
jgi:hypothetical protein